MVLGKYNKSAVSTIRLSIVGISTPVLDLLAKPVDTLFDMIESAGHLAKIKSINEVLVNENIRLYKGYMRAMQIEAENMQLRKILNVVSEPDFNYITVRVISHTNNSFLHSVLVNAGKNHNVKKGQAVINDQGLIGRVVEVGDKASRVLLVTDINSRIPIVIQRTFQRGILVGNNDDYPYLKFLAKDADINVGDIVLTSGDGNVFPSSQPIGVVHKLENDKYYIRTFANWHKLGFISIVDF
jgi:rod shape-determining protein MreC